MSVEILFETLEKFKSKNWIEHCRMYFYIYELHSANEGFLLGSWVCTEFEITVKKEIRSISGKLGMHKKLTKALIYALVNRSLEMEPLIWTIHM